MAEPWQFSGEPGRGAASEDDVTIVEGSTFCISTRSGDVSSEKGPQGLFVRDTRVLSRWEIRVNGSRPTPLSVQHGAPFAATFVTRLPALNGAADSTTLVVRRRFVGDGMREDIAVRNAGMTAETYTVVLDADADFADLFEVKDGRAGRSAVAAIGEGGVIRIESRRDGGKTAVAVTTTEASATTSTSITWTMTLAPHEEWQTSVEVVPVHSGVPLTLSHPRGHEVEQAVPAQRLQRWRHSSPEIRTGHVGFAAALRRSVDDLGSLRIFDPDHPDRAVVAAGSPWFMALFGRDSLLTAGMVLALDTSLAAGTLRTLAEHQGEAFVDATEEQPGRILHELRFGPATVFDATGRTAYYGTADATPLFVQLVAELARWGMPQHDIDQLLPAVDRALTWIVDAGDTDGDGFVEYRSRTHHGLANQGWKDSWDGISFADGSLPEAPIALAEVQAYAYGAMSGRAELAEARGDAAAATLWRDRAAELKQRFNDAFWLPEQRMFAIGLDRDKRPIDAVASNMGHCLWTGIVETDKAPRVAELLMGDDMFTGWGVRTLARSMARYNPMSYHNGSIWPHDNAICAAGLMRYGFVHEAQRVTLALLDAAAHFDGRLPELFCGFDKTEFDEPVRYPAACSPQAWASATPVSLLRTLLRLEPHLPAVIDCSPAVPESLLPLRISGIRIGAEMLDVDVDVDSCHIVRKPA